MRDDDLTNFEHMLRLLQYVLLTRLSICPSSNHYRGENEGNKKKKKKRLEKEIHKIREERRMEEKGERRGEKGKRSAAFYMKEIHMKYCSIIW